MLKTLAIAGYRSIRKMVLPLGELTVVTGQNGMANLAFTVRSGCWLLLLRATWCNRLPDIPTWKWPAR